MPSATAPVVAQSLFIFALHTMTPWVKLEPIEIRGLLLLSFEWDHNNTKLQLNISRSPVLILAHYTHIELQKWTDDGELRKNNSLSLKRGPVRSVVLIRSVKAEPVFVTCRFVSFQQFSTTLFWCLTCLRGYREQFHKHFFR